ncbi:TIGR01777 family oxidoreductase [Leucobacter weissii]|uniref:TIGR01777 family oxidoreductase n=1 Tax=Leucobacter weissii TaxID=1983706 RepID=A0A939MMB8_9MICO|nr:TIGR01777 family oxidoreductase [Leucobacter weissii]MBO1902505.1 TIGR01777 family oxidoreductase [Leucobacter weissii]
MSRHIVIAGSSGLIGGAVVAALREAGDRVTRLVRRSPSGVDEAQWSPADGRLDPALLDGADAVISLGGASVGRLPWTSRYRDEILRSRLDATRTIVRALDALGGDPPPLLSASGAGFYGSAPGAVLTERSPAGTTFLARVCVQWEHEARKIEHRTRVALLRTAPVIHRDGVLKPMITLTRSGLGGPLGGGRQIWPWISLEDEVRGILHVLERGLAGPINFTGPEPASQNRIGRALAEELHRPYWLPAPAWGLRLVLSPAATESLLTSDADVRPDALTGSGFVFSHPTPERAIAAALG